MAYRTQYYWYMQILFHIRDEEPDEWIMEKYYLTAAQLEAFKNLWTGILEPVYKEGSKRHDASDWLQDTFAEGFVEGWVIGLLAGVYQVDVQIDRRRREKNAYTEE